MSITVAKTTRCLMILVLLFMAVFSCWATTLKHKGKFKDSDKHEQVPTIVYLQQTATSGDDDDLGSILDGQEIIIDNSNVNTGAIVTDSSSSPRKTLEKATEKSDSGMDERYAHLLDIDPSDSTDKVVTTPQVTGSAAPKEEPKPKAKEPEKKPIKSEPEKKEPEPKKEPEKKPESSENQEKPKAEETKKETEKSKDDKASLATDQGKKPETTTKIGGTNVAPVSSSVNGFNYRIKQFDSSVKHDIYPSPETDSMVTYGVVFIACILLLVYLLKIFLNYCKTNSYFTMRQYKMKGVYALLRDLAILVFILWIILILHYHTALDFIKTNLENLLYGMYIFILAWIISSVILLYTCYTELETFYDYESISKDIPKLRELKKFYEEQYTNNKRIHPVIIEQLQFQQMRQAFINPIELPIMTECFLRRDFNFSMYLGYCITDFLSEIIGFISIRVYFLLATLLWAYKLINYLEIEVGSSIFYPIPLVCLLILMMCRWHLSSIFKYLVAEVDSPDDIQFQVDLDIRDPFDHINKIPIPPYLHNDFDHYHEPNPSELREDTDSEDDEEDSQFKPTKRPRSEKRESDNLNDSAAIEDSIYHNENEKKKKYKNMFKSGKRFFFMDQNRHERLFWFGKVGVFLQKLLIQGWYITLVLWLSAIVAGDGFDRFYVFDNDLFNIILMSVCIIIALFTILYYFPTVVFAFVLDTSIQMMKRRDYIELVIKEQKHQKALRSMRMYQVFKLIRRELIDYFDEDWNDKELPPSHLRLLHENYEMIIEPYYDSHDRIRINQLQDFYRLSGVSLKKLESYILLKKARSDNDKITFDQLADAIRQTANDVKVDPYDVISIIFMLLLKEQHKLSPEDIRNFFSEYEGYFEQQDVEEFRDEILSLQRDGGLIDIQEIASLIRDDIECFPR